MKLGRIWGTVVATIKTPALESRRLLVVELLDTGGEPTGATTLAVDAVGAGAGETVLVLDEGNSARQILADADAPIRAVVAGIVDQVMIDGEMLLLDPRS